MALTRKFLTALGIEAEKIDEIITAHVDTLEAVKSERDALKVEAEKIPQLQATVDELNKKILETDESKYDELLAEYNQYKSDVAANEKQRNVEAAYKQLLVDSGISEKRINSVLKVTDLKNLELDENGKIVNEGTIKETIKSEWSDFIVQNAEIGANTPCPPTNTHGGVFGSMSLADKMAYANENPTAPEVISFLKGE